MLCDNFNDFDNPHDIVTDLINEYGACDTLDYVKYASDHINRCKYNLIPIFEGRKDSPMDTK